MKTTRRLVPLTLIVVALTACGDLSNEDLGFLAVLPDDGLAVTLPSQGAQALNSSSEVNSIDTAVNAAGRINKIAVSLVKIVRNVTSHKPTTHTRNARIWGPYAVPGFGGFRRLLLQRDTTIQCDDPVDPLEKSAGGFRWIIEGSPTRGGQYDAVSSGTVRGLDFSHSCGTVDFDAIVSRSLGGSETADDPSTVHLEWTRGPHGTQISATVNASPSGDGTLVEGTTYDYKQIAAGNGHFSFAERYRPRPVIAPAEIHILDATIEWGPKGHPWRTDYSIADDAQTPLYKGVLCGAAFGDATFHAYDVPPSTQIDTSSDSADCSFDYTPGN